MLILTTLQYLHTFKLLFLEAKNCHHVLACGLDSLYKKHFSDIQFDRGLEIYFFLLCTESSGGRIFRASMPGRF